MKLTKEQKVEINMYQSNDWELSHEKPTHFVLKKNVQTGLGHFFVGLFTIWWTFGIGNLIYWGACHRRKKVFK